MGRESLRSKLSNPQNTRYSRFQARSEKELKKTILEVIFENYFIFFTYLLFLQRIGDGQYILVNTDQIPNYK